MTKDKVYKQIFINKQGLKTYISFKDKGGFMNTNLTTNKKIKRGGEVFETTLKKPLDFDPNKCNFYQFMRDHFITFEKINLITFLNDVFTVHLQGLYIIKLTLI